MTSKKYIDGVVGADPATKDEFGSNFYARAATPISTPKLQRKSRSLQLSMSSKEAIKTNADKLRANIITNANKTCTAAQRHYKGAKPVIQQSISIVEQKAKKHMNNAKQTLASAKLPKITSFRVTAKQLIPLVIAVLIGAALTIIFFEGRWSQQSAEQSIVGNEAEWQKAVERWECLSEQVNNNGVIEEELCNK